MPQRPNVLLIVADQLQAPPTEAGHPCKMPHVERLASEGLRFSRAYTPCPICVPARISLMTGLYPHTHGLIDNSGLPGGSVLAQKGKGERDVFEHRPLTGLRCFSQNLAESGYRCMWSGRWHVYPGHHPEDVGFEAFDYTEAEYGDYRKSLGLKYGLYSTERAPNGFDLSRQGFKPMPLYGKCDEPVEGMLDHWTVERALGRMDELCAGGDPWFLGVGLLAPHDPFVIPEPYASMYSPDDVPLPTSFNDPMADKPALYRRQRDVVYADMTARHYREMIACYWGFCAFFDDLVGKLLARLDERGAAGDTLAIVTSDHGESMGAHGLVYKSLSMFDESIRIPMIARWPGRIEPGGATGAPVMLHDIGPTVLEAAGAEPLAGVHGESLVGTMTGSGHDLERAGALIESEGAHVRITQRTLVRGPFKYVFNAFDYDELYNLEEDPGELHNLAQDPRHAHTVREMATALTDELVRLGDHLPTVRQPHTNLLPVGPDADYRNEGTGG